MHEPNTIESEFKEWLRISDFSKSTRLSFLYSQQLLNKYLEYSNSSLNTLNRFDIIAFINYLKNSFKLKENTIARYVYGVKVFFKFLKTKGIEIPTIPKNIETSLINKTDSHYKYLGDLLEISEIDALLNFWKTSKDKDNPRGIRNQLIISLLWDTGMKLSELRELERENIIDYQLFLNNAKYKHKQRTIKIGPETQNTLNRYLIIRKDKNQCLIVSYQSYDGFIVSAWPLSSRGIERVLTTTAKQIGIDKRITPTSLRASRVKNLLDNGKKIREINEELGLNPNSRLYLKIKRTLSDRHN